MRRLAIWATLTLVVFLLVDRNWAGYRVDRARWHYARGMGYNDSNRLDQAMEEWQEAVELNPEYVSAHIDLGIGLVLRGRYEEAFRHLNRAVEIEPQNPHALFNLGAFYENLGRFEESRSRYLRALEIDPSFRSARSGLLRIEAARQREPQPQEGEFSK